MKLSAIEFVYIVKKHKPRILHSFPENELTKITEEHQQLALEMANKPCLKSSLEEARKKSFNIAWAPLGKCFPSLRRFVSGLASVMPTTSRVEANFSFINYRKDEFNSALSDFSLEGVLFARQRNDLETLLNCMFE